MTCASECVTEARALGRYPPFHVGLWGRFYPFHQQFRSLLPLLLFAVLHSLPFHFSGGGGCCLSFRLPKHSHFSSAIRCDEWEFMSKRAAIITFNNSRHPLVVHVSTYRLAIYYLPSAAGRESRKKPFHRKYILNEYPNASTDNGRHRIYNRQSCCSPVRPMPID